VSLGRRGTYRCVRGCGGSGAGCRRCEAALHEAMIPVGRRYPVVVTTNAGLSARPEFLSNGEGDFGCDAACGSGRDSDFDFALRRRDCRTKERFGTSLGRSVLSAELHNRIRAAEKTRHDHGQVQTLLQCLEKARVVLFSELTEEQRRVTRTEQHGGSGGHCYASWRERKRRTIGGGDITAGTVDDS